MTDEQTKVTSSVAGDTQFLAAPSPLLLAVGGLIGSILGLGLYRAIYPIFLIPDEILNIPSPPPVALIAKLEAYQLRVDCQNYPIVFGLMGLSIGATCAMFALQGRILGVALTSILGGILGAAGALLCAMIVGNSRATAGSDIVLVGITIDSLAQAIIGQACIWGLMGCGVGAGIGLTTQGFFGALKVACAGLWGGAFGALVFVVGAAVLAPNSSSNHVVPLPIQEQIALTCLAGVCIGFAIGLGFNSRKKKTAAL
ncbi:MAG TPA: hypothetical protein VM260_28070 [Pirellula sp.]|nr:hypothetical protein [Pirellula sp.]